MTMEFAKSIAYPYYFHTKFIVWKLQLAWKLDFHTISNEDSYFLYVVKILKKIPVITEFEVKISWDGGTSEPGTGPSKFNLELAIAVCASVGGMQLFSPWMSNPYAV